MSSAPIKIKAGAILLGRIVLIFLGWCLVMTIYITTYNQIERNAVPTSIPPFRDFSVEQWDNGYFHVNGSLKNESAKKIGEEATLQTTDLTCRKASNTCVISTAKEFNGFMNREVSSYNIEIWDSKSIAFSDSSSICTNYTYVVDRIAQTFNISVRNKLISDYALKSPLPPCNHMKDQNLSLISGRQAYGQRIRSFERANGIYLHLYLVALNLVYFALIAWSIRRRRQRSRAKGVSSA